MHDVGLVAVDKELEAVADDEDEDDADEHGRHVHVPPLTRRHRRQHLKMRDALNLVGMSIVKYVIDLACMRFLMAM